MEELPNELIVHAFSYLHFPIKDFSTPHRKGRTRDLAVLCRVCRRFRDLATPFVYESIEREIDINNPAFYQLPRALLSNPELRKHIKSVRLKASSDNLWRVGRIFDYESWNYKHRVPVEIRQDVGEGNDEGVKGENEEAHGETTSEEDDPYFLLFGERYAESEADESDEPNPHHYFPRHAALHDVLQGFTAEFSHLDANELLKRAVLGSDPLLDTIVLLAPNLQRLWVRIPLMYGLEETTVNVPQPFASGPVSYTFNFLNVLHIDLYRNPFSRTSEGIISLLLLPALTDLTIGRWGKLQDRPSNIPTGRDVTLHTQEFSLWPVRTSTAITEFELVRVPHYSSNCYRGYYEQMGPALIEHSDTLVKVSTSDYQIHGGRVLKDPGVLRLGPDFASLRTLRMPVYLLFTPHLFTPSAASEGPSILTGLLPSSLEDLRLDLAQEWGQNMELYLGFLYQAYEEGHFPHLKSVHFYWYLEVFDYSCPTFLRISQVNEEMGQLMRIRALFEESPVAFDIYMLVDCSPKDFPPDSWLSQFAVGIISWRRFSIFSRQGSKGTPMVEGSTNGQHHTQEEIQEEMSHGYWHSGEVD
ncbi:hypothetical protein TW65_07990 [Stemphylium lycopersici]|uniref:F-box domain-containing protein n=1 Tax=Stemphylium lycopersici TaxID=183478 RepID=A0A364MZV0_STELY|nr:hypothetical protein TW65_07990 [Stemphylium lycopersici]RAR08059.1 hypothetical protein DDE83_006159 [Stemphylium lycopersici]